MKAAEEAQSQRSAHLLRSAREKFLACAQESCPAVVRNDCAGWLSEVDKLMPSIVVQARDTRGVELVDVRVVVDGQVVAERLDGLAVSVDPGVHLFQFEATGVPPLQQRILIREGEKGRAMPVTLAAIPPPPPDEPKRSRRRTPTLTYVLGGIGVGGLAGFTFFGIKGLADANEIGNSPCGRTKTCPEEQLAPVRRELIVADVSLAIGLGSLGAAAYFYFTEREPAPTKGVRPQLLLAPGVAGLGVESAF